MEASSSNQSRRSLTPYYGACLFSKKNDLDIAENTQDQLKHLSSSFQELQIALSGGQLDVVFSQVHSLNKLIDKQRTSILYSTLKEVLNTISLKLQHLQDRSELDIVFKNSEGTFVAIEVKYRNELEVAIQRALEQFAAYPKEAPARKAIILVLPQRSAIEDAKKQIASSSMGDSIQFIHDLQDLQKEKSDDSKIEVLLILDDTLLTQESHKGKRGQIIAEHALEKAGITNFETNSIYLKFQSKSIQFASDCTLDLVADLNEQDEKVREYKLAKRIVNFQLDFLHNIDSFFLKELKLAIKKNSDEKIYEFLRYMQSELQSDSLIGIELFDFPLICSLIELVKYHNKSTNGLDELQSSLEVQFQFKSLQVIKDKLMKLLSNTQVEDQISMFESIIKTVDKASEVLICPVTHEIVINPVKVGSRSQVYDRKSLDKQTKDPISREPIEKTDIKVVTAEEIRKMVLERWKTYLSGGLVAKFESINQKSKETIDELKKNRDISTKTLNEMNLEIYQLHQQLQSAPQLEEAFNRTNEELILTKQTKDYLTKQLHEAERKIRILQGAISSYKQESDQKDKDYQTLKEENEKLKKVLDQTIFYNELEINNLKGTLKKQQESFEEEKNKHTHISNQLNSEIGELKREVESLRGLNLKLLAKTKTENIGLGNARDGGVNNVPHYLSALSKAEEINNPFLIQDQNKKEITDVNESEFDKAMKLIESGKSGKPKHGLDGLRLLHSLASNGHLESKSKIQQLEKEGTLLTSRSKTTVKSS